MGSPILKYKNSKVIDSQNFFTPLIYQTMSLSELVYDRFIATADDLPAIPNEPYRSKRDRVERFLMNNTIHISIVKTPQSNDEDEQVNEDNNPILQRSPQPTIDSLSDLSKNSTAFALEDTSTVANISIFVSIPADSFTQTTTPPSPPPPLRKSREWRQFITPLTPETGTTAPLSTTSSPRATNITCLSNAPTTTVSQLIRPRMSSWWHRSTALNLSPLTEEHDPEYQTHPSPGAPPTETENPSQTPLPTASPSRRKLPLFGPKGFVTSAKQTIQNIA